MADRSDHPEIFSEKFSKNDGILSKSRDAFLINHFLELVDGNKRSAAAPVVPVSKAPKVADFAMFLQIFAFQIFLTSFKT